ncbi:diphosphomevalonate decarboxylase [Halobacteriovorax sp. JY17]|uniref:diphosphomevalonate decarboxylase n=1 Tax=Halobacteriovorax sp. JY17 TaxID=2014617 RepID=UPI000C3A362C|nr:diphosphomevalonate decarboxylase [Halobacteriovorax sp. JY17]PIK15488.1 MAG: diphosphomevalonate decarboxylase [Halobacteriovorax sp. JY17]
MNTYIKQYTKKELVEDTGRISWTSPSNIALIKYWGKHGKQLPCNPSVSFTLSESKTTMDFSWSIKDGGKDEIVLDFYFENKKNALFEEKIRKFLEDNFELFPFLKYLSLEIESVNSFPHSAGIASSASSMSALALGLCSIENQAFDLNLSDGELLEKATYVARLASGSAARSIFPGIVSWGKSDLEEIKSSDLIASKVEGIADIFKNYHDSIVIVDAGEKAVSSRAGHALMEDHPFREVRFQHANKQLENLITIMKTGDVDKFCEIVETEALELHGLMMNSTPSYTLMRPNTLAVIEKVRKFRSEKGLALCFTLDAGPNVHLLYPDNISREVTEFINSEITEFAENGLVIHDRVGSGPERFL